MTSRSLSPSSSMNATTTSQMTTLWFYRLLLTAKPPLTPPLHPLHCAPLPPPPRCRPPPRPPALAMRTLMARRVRQPSSSLVGAPAPTEKSLRSSLITGHRATLPALHLEATREERPGCLVPTTRAATTRSRAPPAPKVNRATSHTTRATARRGKMCETPHKKTSADRGDLACPPSPLPSLSPLPPILVCN